MSKKHLKKQMEQKEQQKQTETLAGSRTRVNISKQKRLPGPELASSISRLRTPSYFDRRPVFPFLLKNKSISLHTAHARVTHGTRHAARRKLDDNVPQTSPYTGTPGLWQAVPFS